MPKKLGGVLRIWEKGMYYERLLKVKNRLYLRPEEFLADACEYFKWCDEHPLLEEKVHFNKDGDITRADLSRMRPYTKTGLASFLCVPVSRLYNYKNRPTFADAIELIEQVIYTQKFEGAAAGLLNSTIISRDLGLAEKQEVVADVTTAPAPSVDEEHLAVHVHPHDTNPLDLPRPLYSRAQLAMGIPFTPPASS